MPGIDGFETAALIKQRERTRDIPIIFLTAISKDEQHVFQGYAAGAVDYIFKPFNPEVLRSKVAVFIDLCREDASSCKRARASSLRERDVAEDAARAARTLPPASPTRCRRSCGRPTRGHARPTTTGAGSTTPGMSVEAGGRERAGRSSSTPTTSRRAIATRAETSLAARLFEVEYRFRAADGDVPLAPRPRGADRAVDGEIEFWIGTATDIHDRKRTEDAQRFLLEAGELLGTSLHFRSTLAAVARLAVPAMADWCSVHIVDEEGCSRRSLRARGPHEDRLRARSCSSATRRTSRAPSPR